MGCLYTLPNHWQEQGKTYLNQKQNIVYKSIKCNIEITETMMQ